MLWYKMAPGINPHKYLFQPYPSLHFKFQPMLLNFLRGLAAAAAATMLHFYK